MPPLPTTLDEDTSQLISSVQRRQSDLATFQIPRLHSCKGPLSLQQSLAAELREDIDLFARKVEALEVLVDDQKGERNRRELRQTVDGLKEDLLQLRKDSRTALLASRRTIDSQSRSQRDELLASSAATEKRDGNEKATDDLMKANDDVTEALRRTISLMQGELERSVLSSQMLDASTASLRSTSTTHDTLTNIMGTSKQLITALEKSDWLDRVLIISAFIFFVLVVLFIVKQRILDRGLRVALWWTRFLPDFSGDADLLQMDVANVASETAPAMSMVTASTLTSTTLAFLPSNPKEPTDIVSPAVTISTATESSERTLHPIHVEL